MARQTPEINAGSMADIAFLLLIFYLVATTMDVDSGLLRRLPPMPDENQQQQNLINKRNILVVKISASDLIFAGNDILDVSQLKDKVIEFVTNPINSESLPEKAMTEIEGFGPHPVSKGIISLQNDRGTSYNAYIQVQNELVKAITEVRNNFAVTNFGEKYANLDKDRQAIVRKAIPQSISEAEPFDATKR